MILFFASQALFAGGMGYVNIERIFNEYSAMNDLRSQLQLLENNWTNEAETKKREWQSLQSQLETEAVTLSEEEISRRRDIISQKKNEYESFVQSVWGDNGLLENKTQELTESPVAQINKTIEEVSELKDISIVLDVSSGVVLYAEPGLDITSEVLTRLNSEYITVQDTTPEEKITIAFLSVVPITADAKASGIAQTASSIVNTALMNIQNVEMSEGSDVSQGMTQNGITSVESVTGSQLSGLATYLLADYIVRGQISQTGEQFNLKIIVFSAEIFSDYLTFEESFEKVDNLEQTIESIVSEIAAEL